MKKWINRCARILGGAVFFAVLTGMMFRPEAWAYPDCFVVLAEAFIFGLAAWLVGIVVFDILLKGICSDMETENPDILLEGGILQHFTMMKEQLLPGGSEMPFYDRKPGKKSDGRMKKR